MKPVIILLNGPRRSGKDTACEAILDKRKTWTRASLADNIKVGTIEAQKLDPTMLDFYESMKDEALDDLGGLLSWRDLVIEHGNDMRELFGIDYWAKKWADNVRDMFDLGVACAVMTDCRFQSELDAALAITPNVLLMRVYRTAKCHNEPNAWDGDIGSWLFPPVHDVPQIALINDGPIEDLRYLAYVMTYQFYRNVNASAPV